MDASEIHEHKIDGAASVFFFARTYGDDRRSAAAYERARAKISGQDNTSLFRVKAPADRQQLLFVLCDTLANAKRARETDRVGRFGVQPDAGRDRRDRQPLPRGC
jgi:hypothetical protein